MNKIFFLGVLSIVLFGIINCSNSNPNNPPVNVDSTGKRPKVVEPDVTIVKPGQKIGQLVGEYDRQQKQFTQNKTYTHFGLQSTDLGVPFRYGGCTWSLFGDTNGDKRKNGDVIAYTTDTNPNNGLSLTFIHDASGIYDPITIPGISQGAFEVPTEGVEVNDNMYIYSTTVRSLERWWLLPFYACEL